MYKEYFGFYEKPFNVTPDPRFIYTNPAYQEAYASLLYGIRERKGFIVLTGEVGTGKTTLLRRLMGNLQEPVHFVFFYNTTLTFDELLSFACEDFGLEVAGKGRLHQIEALNDFLLERLQKDGTGVLLIDEAQNLDDAVLESLRLLSNLETSSEKLLQIVLVGQPELEQKLAQPKLRQLKQRVAIHCQLDCLKEREVGPFIYHRLRLVGCERHDLFTAEAIQHIALYSKGVPRLINIICDSALLVTYSTDQQQVSVAMIEEVAQDLHLKIGVRAPREMVSLESISLSPSTAESHFSGSTKKEAAEKVEEVPVPVARSVPEKPRSLWWVGGGALAALLLFAGAPFSPQYGERFATITGQVKSWFSDVGDHFISLTHQLTGRVGGSEKHKREKISAQDQSDRYLNGNVQPQENPSLGQQAMDLAARGQEASVSESAMENLRVVAGPSVSVLGQSVEGVSVPVKQPDQKMAVLATNNVRTQPTQSVMVRQGATISAIILEAYGTYNALALDLIKEFNPHIVTLDKIATGEQLKLPSLTRETLLREQSDGSYHLILASFTNLGRANEFAQRVRRRGYTVRVTPQPVSATIILQRVEIESLQNPEEVSQAWKLVNLQNVFSANPVPAGNV
jgi:general secretion pathway protein A